jgi:hypothetical protein
MDDTLDNFAFKFFKLYAKYEYYLKANNYFQSNNSGKRIIIDWDKFVNQKIGDDYLVLLGSNSASADYILENPPSNQVVNEAGVIIWRPIINTERSAQLLFAHISRVRNNMFHGGKFNGTWFDPERNILLEHSLIILNTFKYLTDIE